MIKSEIVYFKEGGAEHTDLTLSSPATPGRPASRPQRSSMPQV